MNRTDMLQQMCREVLSSSDLKAVCKTRGLPAQASSSRSLFESYFLSDTGVAAALSKLDHSEVALLHLLKTLDKPVDIAFFHRLYGTKAGAFYRSYTQRYQETFSKVKERLVRGGLLIIALVPETYTLTTKMERWRFILPAPVAAQLPPLLDSARSLKGIGSWRSQVARDKLTTAVGKSSSTDAKSDKLEIVDGELRMGGQPFRASLLLAWQRAQWNAETTPAKQNAKSNLRWPPNTGDASHTMPPSEAAAQILGTLAPGMWSDAEALAAPLAMFCGTKVDSATVCERGWRWGCLSKQEADGKAWYRPAPQSEATDAPLSQFLEVTADGQVKLDLNEAPLETLERLVAISRQRPAPGSRPALLLTPDLVKLGRTSEDVWAQPLGAWLVEHSAAFRQAADVQRQRRGKTILHENLSVARVSDLALRVAIDKALGTRIVTLGEEFIAFPCEALADVRKIVSKSGYVIKEASLRES